MYTKNALAYKLKGYGRYPVRLKLLRDNLFSIAEEYTTDELSGPVKLINTFLHYAYNSVYKGLLVDFVFPEYVKPYPIEERVPLKEFDLPYMEKYKVYYETGTLGFSAETQELLVELYGECSNYHDLFLYSIFIFILAGERKV